MSRVAQQALLASAAAPAATIAFQGNKATDGVARKIQTLTAVPFGTDDASRRIFVVVNVRGSALADVALSSATIGGVAATVVISVTYYQNSTIGAHGVYVLAAALPTGSSGSVVVTFPNNVWVYIGAYRVTNLQSLTPTASNSSTTSSATVKSITVDVKKAGILIAGGQFYSQKPVAITAGVTQDWASLWTTTRYGLGGSLAVTADQTGRTVTFTRTDTSDGLVMNGACLAVALR